MKPFRLVADESCSTMTGSRFLFDPNGTQREFSLESEFLRFAKSSPERKLTRPESFPSTSPNVNECWKRLGSSISSEVMEPESKGNSTKFAKRLNSATKLFTRWDVLESRLTFESVRGSTRRVRWRTRSTRSKRFSREKRLNNSSSNKPARGELGANLHLFPESMLI